MSTITSLGFTIFSRYDGSGVNRANRSLNRLNRNLNNSSSGLNTFTGRWAAMASAVAAFGPGLTPVTGALAALGGGLLSATAAAAAAGGVFAGALFGAVKSTLLLKTSAGALGTKLTQQKTILSQLTPGTAAYKTQLKAVNKAQDEYNHALAKASPAQRDFLNSTNNVTAAWKGFVKATQGMTLPFLTSMINTAAGALHKFVPVVRAVAPLANEVAAAFHHWATAGLLDFWINFMIVKGIPVLRNFIKIARDIGTTVGEMIVVFQPLGTKVVDVLRKGADQMARWATGGGFERFLESVKKNGPQVKAFFQQLWLFTKRLSQVIASLGPLSLSLTVNLLKLVNALPLGLLNAVVIAFVSMKLALMGLQIVTAIAKGFRLLATALAMARFAAFAFEMSLLPFLGIAALIVIVIAAVVFGIVMLVIHWRGAMHGLNVATQFMWHKVIHPIWTAMVGQMHLVAGVAIWLWKNAIRPAWHGIQVAIGFAWHNVIRPAWNGMKSGMQALGDFMGKVWRNVIRPVWNFIKGAIDGAWKHVIRPVFKAISGAVHDVGHAFNVAKDAIKKAWDKIQDIIKKPVKFVINYVIAPMIDIWDKIAGAVGLDKFKITKPHMKADGGHIKGPGGSRTDSIPAMLSNGEYVMNARAVNAYGLSFMHGINALAYKGGGPVRLAAGGSSGGTSANPQDVALNLVTGKIAAAPKKKKSFFQRIGGAISGAFHKVLDFGKWVLGAITRPMLRAAFDVVGGALGHIPGAGHWSQMIVAGGRKLLGGVMDHLFKKSNEGGAIGGKVPTGARLALLRQALGITHTPPPGQLGQWLAGLNTLISRESGWNAGAINRTDSNAKAGHPSQGLMQMIPSTFAAHWLPGHHNILNGLDNVISGIRYIKSRYGNITKVQQANANLPPKGYARGGPAIKTASYDSGGYLPPGWSLAHNGTGRPERVGGGGYNLEFHNCTFAAGSSRDVEDMMVKALTNAQRKGRIPR